MTCTPVAVLGLGGIGGMLAARTGALCVGTSRTVEAIRANGLTLTRGDETATTYPAAVERLEEPVCLLVVAVKAYELEAAVERIGSGALDGATVLPLLNGLEHVEALRERFAARDTGLRALPVVVAGSIGRVEALSPEPGVVVQLTASDALITVASRELDHASLDDAVSPLRVAGVEVVIANRERAVLWEKAARLAVLAPATVAAARPVAAIRDDTIWGERMRDALGETVAVAAAEGVMLRAADQWDIILAMPARLTTSAARDAAAGRPTELDAITGSVVRAGRRLGVPTPALAQLLEEALCRAR